MSWQQRTLYSVSGGPALTTDSVGIFRFLHFLFISLPICQPICVSVGLFAIHLKFLKTRYYEIPTQSANIGPQDVPRTSPSNVPRTSPKDPI